MKTNCGKTTSLIHREVDDENKLISNIAAKKIKANMGGGGLEGGSVKVTFDFLTLRRVKVTFDFLTS